MSANSHSHEWNSYQRAWEQEFETDMHAIADVEEGQAREKLIRGSIMALLFILFHERVAEALDPTFAAINSHPPTVERLERIGKRFGNEISMSESWRQTASAHLSKSADEMVDHFRQHPDLLTMYGSVYLGEWKGPQLIDRVDY